MHKANTKDSIRFSGSSFRIIEVNSLPINCINSQYSKFKPNKIISRTRFDIDRIFKYQHKFKLNYAVYKGYSNSKRITVAEMNIEGNEAQWLSKNAAKFSPVNDNVFERVASNYDVICNLFSFGLHHLWKRHFVASINKEPWLNLLDVASGTGEIAHKLLSQNSKTALAYFKPHSLNLLIFKPPLVNSQSLLLGPVAHNKGSKPQVIVSDLSEQMLQSAKLKLADYQQYTKFIPLDAHNMTDIAANSQDVVTISMGLKLLDRQQALSEAFRVLKPRGRLITMEVSTLSIGWLHRLYLKGLTLIIPCMAKVTKAKDPSVYRYLLQGIKDFPEPTELAKEINDIGFREVSFKRLSMGVVAIHSARKL